MADLRRRVRDVSESSECDESAIDTTLSVTECVSYKDSYTDHTLKFRFYLAYLSWLCYISDNECYSESQLYLYG